MADQRAVRRDIPITNSIRRAYGAGTRDSTGKPGRNYWQLWTDYTIKARLDQPTSTVTGSETIVLRNNSPDTLRQLFLRLDQNYFSPTSSRIGALGSIEVTQGMKVSRLVVNGQTVTTGMNPRTADPNSPSAFNLQNTIATIALPRSGTIAPRATATIEIDWSFKVPNVPDGRGQRMGRLADTLYQVAQWYPRLTVYDDLRGWDSEAYLGNAEFYNNFGRWDVSLDVPGGWIVGATGVLQNPETVLSAQTRERLSHALESDQQRVVVGVADLGPGRATAPGDRLVWRFVADTANDFAWATAKSYLWDVTRATIPGRGPIPVHLVYQPADSADYKRTGAIARHALEFYSKMWIPYAFPQLTLSDGPELGMEYPMFIMSASGAADHETGHEWWPMMVSNNETWYGWMDEGFNQYMNVLSDADRAGRPAVLDGMGQAYGLTSGNEVESPMMWDANYQGAAYAFTTYGKAPQMLSMLGALVGDTAVWRAQSEFARAWRFKHPSPWDYMFSMQNSLNRDLGWFWNYWLFTTDAVQGSLTCTSPLGSGPTSVTVRQDGQMPAPIVMKVTFAPTGAPITPMANSRMLDSANALVTYPVDVWFNGNKNYVANLDFGARPITAIQLDPYRRFPDRNNRDNTCPRSNPVP